MAGPLTGDYQQALGVAPPDHRRLQVGLILAVNLLTAGLISATVDRQPTYAQSPAPVHKNADTSAGTPLALRGVQGIPPGKSSPVASTPDLVKSLRDTSVSTPRVLLVVAVPAPTINAPHIAPARPTWQPPDTTQGLQSVFESDAGFGPSQSEFQALEIPRVTPTDTSYRPSAVLGSIVPTPPAFGAVSFVSTPGRIRVTPDTSQSTPKPLFSDATPPTTGTSWRQGPVLARPVTDTSQGTPKPLYADGQRPLVNAVQSLTLRQPLQTPDTSQRAILSVPPAAPFVPVDYTRTWRAPQTGLDTSGTARAIYGVVPAPVVNAPQLPIELLRIGRDTSVSSPVALLAAPPPVQGFNQYSWPAPIEYARLSQPHNWDQQANPGSIPPAVPAAVGGRYDDDKKKKKRYQLKVGHQIIEGSRYEIEAHIQRIDRLDAKTEVREIVVPAKRKLPAITVPTTDFADSHRKALEKALREKDEEDVIALLLLPDYFHDA